MEPRKESKKELEPCKEEKKRRFKIEKLEERIAPCGGWYSDRGRKEHFHYRGPCGGR